MNSAADVSAAPASLDLPYRVERSMDNEHLQAIMEPLIHGAVDGEAPLPMLAFTRVRVEGAAADLGQTPEFVAMAQQLRECMRLRRRYLDASVQTAGANPKDARTGVRADGRTPPFDPFDAPVPALCSTTYTCEFRDGVFVVLRAADRSAEYDIPNVGQFYRDLNVLLSVASDGPTKSFAFKRLKLLESKFSLYVQLNELAERAACKLVPHRDFYNVRKVDTHVHHSACMNQKHLLRFIKCKLKRNPNDVVIFRDNQHLTLEQVFQSLKLTAYDLSIDTLDMHAHSDAFHRFDKFNLKYNPVGESRLREIFLKTDNFIGGRYLAELTMEVMADMEESKYQMAEYRVSIYGKSVSEWDKLASWFCANRVFSPNVRWLIQVPRLYSVYKSTGLVRTFADFLRNLFQRLFEATINPEAHPSLHRMLQQVIGFDSVDDESRFSKRIHKIYPTPENWDLPSDPPYSYYIYHMWANVASLNRLRKERGMNTFVLRPHAGEAGNEANENLAVCFLLSYGISHGILLRKVPALQYMYYLEQVGVAMSPLSNNALFLHYDRNPFPEFFSRGLNVSLSTDDPLLLHFTREPLMEEYSCAAQIWRLTAADMCELARNSVLQSGFELSLKRYWIGDRCDRPGVEGNDMNRTNVPDIRIAYRHETLTEERRLIWGDDYAGTYEPAATTVAQPEALPHTAPAAAAAPARDHKAQALASVKRKLSVFTSLGVLNSLHGLPGSPHKPGEADAAGSPPRKTARNET